MTTRPFSLTMQAHQLDLHRLWLTLLLLAMALSLGWVGWALLDHVVAYEDSQSVQRGEPDSEDTSAAALDNGGRVSSARQQWLMARFAEVAYEKLKPGQEAIVLVRGDGVKQAIPAVITKVSVDCEHRQVEVVLRADVAAGEPDPFAQAPPDRVRVAVEKFAPLALLQPRSAAQPTALPCEP